MSCLELCVINLYYRPSLISQLDYSEIIFISSRVQYFTSEK